MALLDHKDIKRLLIILNGGKNEIESIMAKFRRQPLELPRKNYQLGNKDRFVFW
jgi:hypothetical protein